jgi:benzoyl-CoA reductase subunit D
VTQAPDCPTWLTSGIDIGARSVKIAILSHRDGRSSVLATAVVQIPGSRDADDARAAMRDGWGRVLAEANLSARDVDYVASTGTRDRHVARVGPFYGHLSHALGGRLLFPDATVALDVGANQIRCDLLNDPSNGPLGVAGREDEDGGELLHPPDRRAEQSSDRPSAPPVAGPLRESMAARAAVLLRALAVGGKVVLTGGMVLDAGFIHGLWSRLVTSENNLSLLISPEGVFAGAYGAAILAARRLDRISRSFAPGATDPLVPRSPDRHDRSLN